jgi:hypothetical protein
MFLCADSGCRVQVVICSDCDRGHIYCADSAPMRVAGRCIEQGDVTRQAVVAGSNMRSGRGVTGDAKIK